jgi:flagellar protein FliT
MNALITCHLLTKELYQACQMPFNLENRELLIQQIESKLEQRGDLLQQISPPFTAYENKLGLEILEWNKKIEERLSSLYSLVKIDLNKVNQKKNKAEKYINPYQSLQVDGVFYDKKN